MAGYQQNGLTAGVRNGNGKRERVDQEDDQEFMPLSKRINNIHLSPERSMNGHSSSMYMPAQHVPPGPHVNHHPPIANGFHSVPHGHVDSNYHPHSNGFHEDPAAIHHNGPGGGRRDSLQQSASSPEHDGGYINSHNPEMPVMSANVQINHGIDYQYRPVLNESANPHYYEPNRALFELYIQRQMRTNQNPHPDVYRSSSTIG